MTSPEPVKITDNDTVGELGGEHRGGRWIDRNGDEWRWHQDDRGHGWQYLNHADPDARWRYGGMHIPQCGPFAKAR